MDFMDKLIKPLTDTHSCPVHLTIGLPQSTKSPRKFVIFCSPFNNDNEEAYNLLNLHYRGTGCKCRVCMVTAIHLNDPVTDIVSCLRDSSVLSVLQHRFTATMIKEWTRPARRRLQPYFTDTELNILRRAKWYGLRPGFTSFHKHFDWLSNLGVGCLITSMTVDLMHTVYKGICEYVIRWSITCIYLICHKNRAVLGMLDNRLKESYVQQSLMPFNKKSIFSKGVSFMFKNTKTSPNALENSTMQGGGLEAQRVPDLLFQLMFAIGTEGLVVPDVNIEMNNNYCCNPTKIILNACTAVCEMVWCLNRR